MKVGDVVRVRNIHLDESNVEPGFLMQILKIRGSEYYVILLQGGIKHVGLKHWINNDDNGLEVISEGR
tara:strand:+ start:1724 stop:1927 length:204 start_codon:yes stop_codon:yes gene_type:complete